MGKRIDIYSNGTERERDREIEKEESHGLEETKETWTKCIIGYWTTA